LALLSLLLLLLLPGAVPAMLNAAPAVLLERMLLFVITAGIPPGFAEPGLAYPAAPAVLCALQEAPAMPVPLKLLLLLLLLLLLPSGNIAASLPEASLLAPRAAPAALCAGASAKAVLLTGVTANTLPEFTAHLAAALAVAAATVSPTSLALLLPSLPLLLSGNIAASLLDAPLLTQSAAPATAMLLSGAIARELPLGLMLLSVTTAGVLPGATLLTPRSATAVVLCAAPAKVVLLSGAMLC
jgi:hypothetical protein